MNLLSGVRLGVGLKLIPGVGVYTLNKLLIFTPAGAPGAARGHGARRCRPAGARAHIVRQVLEDEVGRRG